MAQVPDLVPMKGGKASQAGLQRLVVGVAHSFAILVILMLALTMVACTVTPPIDKRPEQVPEEIFGRFFPHRRPLAPYLAGEGEVLTGVLAGKLVETDRCLRVRPVDGKKSYLIVWPPDHQLKIEHDVPTIFDGAGQPVARVGDSVRLDGGPVPRDSPFLHVHLDVPLDDACDAPFWIVREGVQAEPLAAHGRAPDQQAVRELEWYAEAHRIDAAQAVYRMELRGALGQLPQILELHEADTYGGFWAQSAPDYRFVIQFTEKGEQTLRRYIQDQPYVDIVEVRRVNVSLQELENARASVQAATEQADRQGEPLLNWITTNVVENVVDIGVTDRDRFFRLMKEQGIDLPAYVRVTELDTVPGSQD